MPREKNNSDKTVETLTHEEATRKNIPTAEYQSVMQKDDQAPVKVSYPRGSTALEDEKQTRNRDLDPQLVWRGKDQQDWSDLVVHAPPLYIQEKVHPKVLIDDLLRHAKTDQPKQPEQIDLFADFNGIPEGIDKTEFYQHDQNWSNRMILGDSLQVMASQSRSAREAAFIRQDRKGTTRPGEQGIGWMRPQGRCHVPLLIAPTLNRAAHANNQAHGEGA